MSCPYRDNHRCSRLSGTEEEIALVETQRDEARAEARLLDEFHAQYRAQLRDELAEARAALEAARERSTALEERIVWWVDRAMKIANEVAEGEARGREAVIEELRKWAEQRRHASLRYRYTAGVADTCNALLEELDRLAALAARPEPEPAEEREQK